MTVMLMAFAASIAGGFLLPWWWPAVAGIALGLWKPRESLRTPLFAFLGTSLAWGGMAALRNLLNHGLLSGKVAAIFHLPNGWWMVALTALAGGLTAGFGARLGISLRRTARAVRDSTARSGSGRLTPPRRPRY